MHMHMNPDDVALLWTQSPRFIEIMRSGSGFQHPHYFFSQSDQLTALLQRLFEDSAAYGSCDDYLQAQQALTQLLNESQWYGGLTREQLRQLEPNVRAFVAKVQNVDTFVAEWEERKRQMSMKSASKKRGRSDEEEDEVMSTIKRRRETCSGQMMDVEGGFQTPFSFPSPWLQNPAAQPVMWTQSFHD